MVTRGHAVYGLSTTTEPTEEPVSLAEVKLHARVDSDAEDTLIEGWIRAARRLTELAAGRRWVTQTLTLSLAGWPDDGDGWGAVAWPAWYAGWAAQAYPGGAIRLPVEPVRSVTAVRYYSEAGTLQTLAGVQTWLDHSPPLITPAPLGSWPALQAGRLAPVRVEFVAGYGDSPADVPDMARQAVLLTLGYWYEHRGDSKDPTEYGLPAGACRLLQALATGGYA